jgi:hypothetical protein
MQHAIMLYDNFTVSANCAAAWIAASAVRPRPSKTTMVVYWPEWTTREPSSHQDAAQQLRQSESDLVRLIMTTAAVTADVMDYWKPQSPHSIVQPLLFSHHDNKKHVQNAAHTVAAIHSVNTEHCQADKPNSTHALNNHQGKAPQDST